MPEIHPAMDGFHQNVSVNGIVLTGGLLLKDTTKLIMGTFPPPNVMNAFLNGSPFFYYSSNKNHFWNRIENFIPYPKGLRWKWLNNPLETEQENINRKIDLCVQMGWGFMDFFSVIERLENNAEDINIQNIEDVISNLQFYKALDALPQITSIFCTYLTAFNSLIRKLTVAGYNFSIIPEENSANNTKHKFKYNGRTIEVILMFPASRSFHPKQVKNFQYKFYLK